MNSTVVVSDGTVRPVWSLLVVGRRAAARDTDRISLVADEDVAVACRPGQWLMLTGPDGALLCLGRVEGFDPDELRLDVALADPVAARWAVGAQIGDAVGAELVARRPARARTCGPFRRSRLRTRRPSPR